MGGSEIKERKGSAGGMYTQYCGYTALRRYFFQEGLDYAI